MDAKIKEAFEKVAKGLIEIIKANDEGVSSSECLLVYPRSVFMEVLQMLEEKISVKEAIDEGLGSIFLQILDCSNIKTKKKDRGFFLKKKKRNKKKAAWITKDVIRGAIIHEKQILSGIPETDC